MCPSIAVLGGGAGSGGGGGNGAGSGDGSGPGDGSGNGDGASGDGRNGGQGCGDPVCPITGRVFVDVYDFGFTSPLPLRWIRSYSSRTSHLAGELGYGWSFAYGWRLHEKRREVVVVDDGARAHRFEGVPAQGEVVTNDLGWRLCREADRYRLVVADGTQYELVAFTDGVFQLVAVADAHGNRIQLERSEDGTLRSMVDAAGRPFRVTTDASRRLVAITAPLDATRQRWVNVAGYEYDGAGNLIAFTDPDGFTWRYEYEGHLLTAHRTPGGLTYHYRYDRGGVDARCVESWGDRHGGGDPALDVQPPPRPEEGPDRRPFKGIQHIRLEYVPADRYTEVTDALGGVTRYFGDERGRVTKVVDAAGGITTRTFDPVTGALVEETMPDGTRRRIHREGREARGYVDDRGGSPRVVFDGQWETIVDSATNQVTRRRIDGRGTQVEVLHDDGTQEMVEPDARGLIAREVNRLGVVIRYVHDAQRQPDGGALPGRCRAARIRLLGSRDGARRSFRSTHHVELGSKGQRRWQA